jgi:hypothetical protein
MRRILIHLHLLPFTTPHYPYHLSTFSTLASCPCSFHRCCFPLSYYSSLRHYFQLLVFTFFLLLSPLSHSVLSLFRVCFFYSHYLLYSLYIFYLLLLLIIHIIFLLLVLLHLVPASSIPARLY